MSTYPEPAELRNIVEGWDRIAYFSDGDAINFHSLWDFQRDPRLYSEGYFETREETEAMTFGTMAHTLILEGRETFDIENVLWTPPVNEKTGEPYGAATKAYKESLAEAVSNADGRRLYTPETAETLVSMLNALKNHPLAKEYLFNPEAKQKSELKFRGEYAPGWFARGSIDRYDADLGIIDLKTAAEIERFDGRKTFEQACLYNGYLEQLAFYQIMFRDLIDPDPGAEYIPVTLIGIEKKPPYRVAVCQPDEETQRGARSRVLEALAAYMEAVSTGNFPSRYDEIITLHRNY